MSQTAHQRGPPGKGSLPLHMPGASHQSSVSSWSFCSVTVVVSSAPSLLFVSSLPLRLWVAFVLAYVFLSLLAASPQPALDEEPHIREGNKVFGCSQRETVGLLRLGREVSKRAMVGGGGGGLLQFCTKSREPETLISCMLNPMAPAGSHGSEAFRNLGNQSLPSLKGKT